MVSSTLALVTPSYAPDYDRCQLLVNSVQAFAQGPIRHYIIVDGRDYGRFQSLVRVNTEVLTVESLLPRWILRLPLVSRAWLSLKTPPLRNWIVQQLVKIAFAKTAREATTVFVDSDVAFVRPFNLGEFARQGQTRLFRVPAFYAADFEPWYQAAYGYLGLSGYVSGVARPNYIGNLITWKQANVVALCDRIEQVSGRSWIETLATAKTLSEYVLYGVFVDQVLGADAGHFYDWSPLCLEYWDTQPLNSVQLAEFFATPPPETVAVMISAKAGMPPSRYADYLKHWIAGPGG
ncbi:MAG: DUF6492 family protein [Nodosilinea sp.]